MGLIAVRQIHVHKQTPPAIDVHLRHCKYVCVYTYKMFTRLLELPRAFSKGLSSLINRLGTYQLHVVAVPTCILARGLTHPAELPWWLSW